MKKQRATDWLFIEMEHLIRKAEVKNMDKNDFVIEKIKLSQKANIMFEEQIKKAWVDGNYNTDEDGMPSENHAISDDNYFNKNFIK